MESLTGVPPHQIPCGGVPRVNAELIPGNVLRCLPMPLCLGVPGLWR
jgi:hypothetical protein